MELDCGTYNTSTETPILTIGKDRVPYRVVEVNKSYPIVTIKLQNMPSDKTCNNLIFNNAINESVNDDHLFAYNPSVITTITLHHNCDGLDDQITYRSERFPGSNVTCNYQHSPLEDGSSENCDQPEVVPVLARALDHHNRSKTLLDVFKQGLEVQYDATPCVLCQYSGGVCGSSDSQFACFCKHHSSRDICQVSGFMKSWIIASVISALGICVCILLVIVRSIRKRISERTLVFSRNKKEVPDHNVDTFLKIYGSLTPERYAYASLRKMTNGFIDKLGEGGYAIVYRGKLPSNRLVAVKVLKQLKGKGEDFINEVASISRTNHVNIVSLLGFCYEGSKRALIYEFMPNGSLDRYTYGGPTKESLPWDKLLDIAIGIAKGLQYLHHGCNTRILHFDIKPHNILLDDEFCPKISDFGLARLCPLQESTISMLEARGTIGYIAPEVFCRNFGSVSHKSDVYSFGMMFLDMVCGRTNLSADEQRSSQMYFPEWIYNQLEIGEEAAFQGTVNEEEKALQRKMIAVSLWCIQTYPSKRPSMSKVIEMLQGCAESIEIPPRSILSSLPRLPLDTSSETLVQLE